MQLLHFSPASILSSKRDNELLLRLIANLNMLLKDEGVNVVKKAILTLTQLYKVTLQVNMLPTGLNLHKDKLRLMSLVSLHSAASGWFALKQCPRGRRHAGIWSRK